MAVGGVEALYHDDQLHGVEARVRLYGHPLLGVSGVWLTLNPRCPINTSYTLHSLYGY